MLKERLGKLFVGRNMKQRKIVSYVNISRCEDQKYQVFKIEERMVKTNQVIIFEGRTMNDDIMMAVSDKDKKAW